MRNMRHIMSGVNVEPLVRAIQRQPDLWNEHKERTNIYGGPHTGISDIWLRYRHIDEITSRACFAEEHDSVWYPSYSHLPEVNDIVFPLMASVRGERLGGVLITKIPPGVTCMPHVDKGWHAEYYDKYAVQLQSAPRQHFHFQNESFCAKPGDVYWFDNSKEHWVTNESNVDRMTMIVCIRHNRYERNK